jgi:ABC-2 type transport system permease protein
MLHRYIIAEILKLRRSLVLLLCLAAPTCVVVLTTLVALRSERPTELDKFAMGSPAMWAFAMLPLAITALSVLMAQMEHSPRTWFHLLTMPGARPRVFLAKALVMLALIAAMSVLIWGELLVGGQVIAELRKDASGTIDPAVLAILLAKMGAATTLVAMIQLWVALAFRSFVPPLVLGIAGTFAAIAATSAEEGVYFPWLMAVNMLTIEPGRQLTALLLGGGGGLLVLVLMLVHLSRREA